MKTVIICYEKKAQEFLLLLNHLLIESSKIVSAQLQTEILDSLEFNTLKWSVGTGDKVEIYFRKLSRSFWSLKRETLTR